MAAGSRKPASPLTHMVLCLFSLGLCLICSSCVKVADPDKPWSYMLDARLVISGVEAVHPAFLLDEVPEGYGAAKAEYLQTAAGIL
ncbi:MAG: hypothetical protein ACOX35_07330 [Bacillota bacterium]|jgi:hypothetical protein